MWLYLNEENIVATMFFESFMKLYDDTVCRNFKGLVERFNVPKSPFRQRCSYVLSRDYSWRASSYHVLLCPSVTDSAAWKAYKHSDPLYVGNKGAFVMQVLSGTVEVLIYRNSLSKSEYIRTHRSDLVHVLNFAQSYLEPEGDGFADRQVFVIHEIVILLCQSRALTICYVHPTDNNNVATLFFFYHKKTML